MRNMLSASLGIVLIGMMVDLSNNEKQLSASEMRKLVGGDTACASPEVDEECDICTNISENNTSEQCGGSGALFWCSPIISQSQCITCHLGNQSACGFELFAYDQPNCQGNMLAIGDCDKDQNTMATANYAPGNCGPPGFCTVPPDDPRPSP